MDMKWNPIIGGDLSEVPRDENTIFTVFDEDTGEFYTATGVVNDYMMGYGYLCIGAMNIPVEVADIKAWMELPESFKPGRCSVCKHWEQWIDNFGDHHSKCKLLDDVPFSHIISLKSCPLEGGKPW